MGNGDPDRTTIADLCKRAEASGIESTKVRRAASLSPGDWVALVRSYWWVTVACLGLRWFREGSGGSGGFS